MGDLLGSPRVASLFYLRNATAAFFLRNVRTGLEREIGELRDILLRQSCSRFGRGKIGAKMDGKPVRAHRKGQA